MKMLALCVLVIKYNGKDDEDDGDHDQDGHNDLGIMQQLFSCCFLTPPHQLIPTISSFKKKDTSTSMRLKILKPRSLNI